MSRYAVINSGNVINVVEWDGVSSFNPGAGNTLVQSNVAGPGWTYNGTTFMPPTPPTPISAPPNLKPTLDDVISVLTTTQQAKLKAKLRGI